MQAGAFRHTDVSVISRANNKLAHELAAVARRLGDFKLIADVPAEVRHVMRDELVSTMV